MLVSFIKGVTLTQQQVSFGSIAAQLQDIIIIVRIRDTFATIANPARSEITERTWHLDVIKGNCRYGKFIRMRGMLVQKWLTQE